MIIDIHNLQKEIGKVLKLKITGIPVLIAEQENPVVDNWVSFKLTDWKQLGGQIEGYDDEDLDNSEYTTSTLWRVTLNTVFIGLLSEQNALTFAHNLNKTPYLDSFSVLGLDYLNASAVKSAPRMLSTGWEQRHIVDVNFNIAISDTDELDFVDIIEVTHEVEGELGNVIFSRTDEIDI
jgi:hypothetical protein